MDKNNSFCEICKVIVPKTEYLMHCNGKKHQRISKEINKDASGIFVTGFPESVDENDIVKFFSSYGTITDHYLDKKQKKFLIIGFQNSKVVDILLKKTIFFQGRKLRINRRVSRRDKEDYDGPEVNLPVLDCPKILSQLKDLNTNFDEQISKFVTFVQNGATNIEDSKRLERDLKATLESHFPNCKLFRFGSTVTDLCFVGSDVDIYCSIGNVQEVDQYNIVKKVRNILKQSKYYTKVFAITSARIPIVRFVHVPTRTSCDLNFRNMLGVYNSKFIKFCWQLDERLKKLMLVIKFWGKIKGYSSGSGKFSNYLLAMLMFFYLQQKYDFPSIRSMLQIVKEDDMVENWNPHFKTSPYDLKKIKETSLKDLLYGFFEFYAEFDFGMYVVSLYLGKPLLKILFLETENLPDELSLYKTNVLSKKLTSLVVDKSFCVQDPFELNNNIAKGTNLKILEMFCTSCKAATFIIMNNFKKNTLWCLFSENPNFSTNNTEIVIGIPPQLIYLKKHVKSKEINENEIRTFWFQFYRDYLKKILEDVLLLKTQTKEENSSATASKVLKKYEYADVLGEEVFDSVTFECFGEFNVLTSRKQGNFENTFSGNILEQEMQISNFLKQNSLQKNDIKFELSLIGKCKPTEIIIKLKYCVSNENYFQSIAKYIRKSVTALFSRYINELEEGLVI